MNKQQLTVLMNKARRNATRIYNGQKIGKYPNSRYQFWEQVCRDYQRQINSL